MSKLANPTAPFDVHPSVAYVQTVLANLQVKTGRSASEWAARLTAVSPTDTKAWLKAQGLGTTQISFVLQRATARPGHAFDDTPEGYLAAAPGYVDAALPWLRRAYERDGE